MERTTTSRLGIELLSVFGLPPVEFVNLAADLGCDCISAGLTAIPYNPHGYPPFSLRDDAHLRREMIAALRDRGVSVSLGEGFIVRPGRDVRDAAADMDIMQELGAERLNTLSMDPDLGRTLDQFAVLAEMAGSRGLETTVELCPFLTINNLDVALAAIRHVGRPDFRLLLDVMHLGRSGTSVADIKALDPTLIGYVQLSDAPLKPINPNYMDEATFQRMVPGEGEMPLREYLAALPPGLVIGLEVPLRAQAEAGMGPAERLGQCVEAARGLLPQQHCSHAAGRDADAEAYKSAKER
jgi:sugar phosphate isomerase/epimerase